MKYLSLSIPGYNGTPVELQTPAHIPHGGVSDGTVNGILQNSILLFFSLLSVIALFFIIYGGIRWIMSGGDKVKIESARKTIIFAIIGLVLAFLAFAIINFIGQIFGVSLLASGSSNQPTNNRDSQRKTDLAATKSALAHYYSDAGFYPTARSSGNPTDYPKYCGTPLSYHGVTYLNVLCDPLFSTSGTNAYLYVYVPSPTGCTNTSNATYCTGYTLTVCAENPKDPDAISVPDFSSTRFPPIGLFCPSGKVFQVTN